MSRLIVASNSARRHQLMRDAGFTFEVKTLDIDESIDENIEAEAVAQYLAIEKNNAYRKAFPKGILLTADTVVIAGRQLMGKPNDEQEAQAMLQKLSGISHRVITGVSISDEQKRMDFQDVTIVTFRKLKPEEINHYVSKYKPLDKAGSYGIQEWIGMIGVESIEGSYYNVMGLPMHKVYKMLTDEFGIFPFGLKPK